MMLRLDFLQFQGRRNPVTSRLQRSSAGRHVSVERKVFPLAALILRSGPRSVGDRVGPKGRGAGRERHGFERQRCASGQNEFRYGTARFCGCHVVEDSQQPSYRHVVEANMPNEAAKAAGFGSRQQPAGERRADAKPLPLVADNERDFNVRLSIAQKLLNATTSPPGSLSLSATSANRLRWSTSTSRRTRDSGNVCIGEKNPSRLVRALRRESSSRIGPSSPRRSARMRSRRRPASVRI
jgi:hypothetical protein